ncbi:flavin-binding monooxygenase-like protein [Histoplasma capsulatum]|uniref:Flavin-binding monooxygenase-like protein n=1 Tax=Ajellomyces capsulatus TaxID=5037 RepID=A0A8A1M0V8_AJECA|nr:flavin-binding monooxygenase-like protein [Histoplasma capsulatum]
MLPSFVTWTLNFFGHKFPNISIGIHLAKRWYGLGAAKQYNCTRPDDSLAIFESESSLGGTWGDQRLYPLLKSNNLFGTYEYPDFPMDAATFGIKPGQHIPGPVINAYLKAYAAKFSITNLIRLQTKVIAAEHQDTLAGGWILTVTNSNQEESKVFTRRLIVATGMTSEAFLPHFQGQETFGGPIFHNKHFMLNRGTLTTAKSVTIFGATKSAWDAAYAYAMAGVKVNWVIRSTGRGPCWMSPPFVTPLKKWIEKLANIRFLTWFSPCVFSEAGGYSAIRNFLHGTAIGRAIVNIFWSIIGGDVITLGRFDKHPETAKLKPWTHPMFTGTSFSIFNYDTDIFDLIKKGDKISIHIGEVTHLSPGKVHLADGTELDSDAFLAVTGWKHVPPMKFLPEGIDKELGLPHARSKDAPAEDLANQQDLIERADREIFERYPRLKDQPVWNKDYVPLTSQTGINTTDDITPWTPLTPYMLHRFIVPPSERFLKARDVAFVGMVSNFSNILTAHLQGLWVSAYFSGLLANDPAAAIADEKAMQALCYEAVLHNRFGKWRYPTDWGSRAPSFIFDAVPYLDMLLHDMGLEPHRKRGFMTEIWDPYGPEDYRNVNEEWQKKYENTKGAI